MEAWPLADKLDCVHHVTTSGKGHVTRLQNNDASPEEKALDTFFQQTGGQYGGWDQYDHQNFLKVWTKHSGRPSYIREVMAYLPARTQEEVLQHEEWYLKLQDLQEDKREVLYHGPWKQNIPATLMIHQSMHTFC